MNYEKERHQMVRDQISSRGIKSKSVLNAFEKVERHLFVSEDLVQRAYQDKPLPIGIGQTISQPYIVALMTELLKLKGNEKVLEIGTGSGYQAAILGEIAAEVHSVERHKILAERANNLISSLGYRNIEIHVGDGSNGWADEAPYDAIIVTASAPSVPEPLKKQLVVDGLLVIPVGSQGAQTLEVWKNRAEGFTRETVAHVAFVPLIGDHGWESDPRRK